MPSKKNTKSAGRKLAGHKQDTHGVASAGPHRVVQSTAQASQTALRCSIEGDDMHRLDLARRLHKDVAGNLVACTALSEMIRHQLAAPAPQPAVAAATLALVDKALRDTLHIVRTLTEEQLPPVLTTFGMSAALQQFVKQTVGGFTGALILHVDEDELKLDPARRLNLFRLLQTMIRRCVCDARASVVEVSFVALNGQIECTIDHDGEADLWSAPNDADDAGELAVIEARCTLLGCAFRTTPSPTGNSPRVTLSIPRSPGVADI